MSKIKILANPNDYPNHKPFIPVYTEKQILFKDMFADPVYQRQLSSSRVTKINNAFDPVEVQPIKLSTRNNRKYAIIDGQHTRAVLAMQGFDSARCLVYKFKGIVEEAHYFNRFNTHGKKLLPVEIFHARVAELDEVACSINMILQRHGFRVPNGGHYAKEWPFVGCITTTENAFLKGGPRHLSQVFRIIGKSWRNDDCAVSEEIIKGMSHFLLMHSNDLKTRFSESKAIETFKETISSSKIVARSNKLFPKSTRGGGYNRGYVVGLVIENLLAKVHGKQIFETNFFDIETKKK